MSYLTKGITSKMKNFVGELNLSKTLTKMIANRSKQDYHLILMLTFLLVIEIVVCYFYIRPWIKGS